MRIGVCCTDADRIRLIRDTGFDFVEVNNTNVYRMSDGEFARLLEVRRESPKGFFYSCNGLVPPDIRLTGEGVDYEMIRGFSRESFKKLDRLGVKMLVFGSSKAKNVPEGFPFDEAMKQLVRIISIFSEEAKPYGMSVCIEPLNRSECNIINTAEESVALARMVADASVGGHVDYFHMTENGEDMQSLALLAGEIFHTHIASPGARTLPLRDDGADYVSFFAALRAGGYDKTVAFEGRGGKSGEELSAMLGFLRELSNARQ